MLVSRLNGHGLPKDRAEWEVLHPELDWNTHRSKALPGYWEEVSTATTNSLFIVVSMNTVETIAVALHATVDSCNSASTDDSRGIVANITVDVLLLVAAVASLLRLLVLRATQRNSNGNSSCLSSCVAPPQP